MVAPSAPGAFPPLHVIEPTTPHTHTVIMLHGRGSYGDEFAEQFFWGALSSPDETMISRLPGWRWVFPSSRSLRNTVFEMVLPAWFEARSLTNIDECKDLQAPGIAEAAEHLVKILEAEVACLGGKAENVAILGISQGCAIGLWALLSQPRSIGAFIGSSGWLPFAKDIESLVKNQDRGEDTEPGADGFDPRAFVAKTLCPSLIPKDGQAKPSISTPILLCHGVDDSTVDIGLGMQTRDVLTSIGFEVRWREYTGAEVQGHWFKEPEQYDDMTAFLQGLEKRDG